MGSGIAQIAASYGHKVLVYEVNKEVVEKSKAALESVLNRLVEKGKMDVEAKSTIQKNIEFISALKDFSQCDLIIEAIVENLEIKKNVFAELDGLVSKDCILASNTSSLSIASIGSSCKNDERFIGIHFFNPAPLMPLVEIIPSVSTSAETLEKSKKIIDSWMKKSVVAKDTPGFIVNRIARPFYGEAIRIYEEGIADIPTIDQAMKDQGFKMGPFELMDYIGNDVNYTVTETVFREFFFDARYKPSFTQKRMMESGRLGRKTGRGYYSYEENAVIPKPSGDIEVKRKIFNRIIAMLINEAIDALYLKIASKEDLEIAMTNGVNYPKGLLKWADEIGLKNVLNEIERLRSDYSEDRYRPSFLLKNMVRSGSAFFNS